MTPIVEIEFDIVDDSVKVRARLFKPQQGSAADRWTCRFEIDAPIDWAMDIHGSTSLQALALSLKGLSSVLYASDLYRQGRLGHRGVFGGYLGIPAPQQFHGEAPFPF